MNPSELKQAVSCIEKGNIIAYPTEGVYGLGCDPFNEQAVNRLLALKNRPLEKGLIIVAASPNQLNGYVDWQALTAEQRKAILKSWPGPTTWIVPANPSLPHWVTGGRETVAVRVSAHSIVQALCQQWDKPLISTSANPTSQPPAESCQQCQEYFGSEVCCYLEAPLGDLNQPTAIYHAQTGEKLR